MLAVVAMVSSPRWHSRRASTVDVATSANFGTVLVDAQGFALYTLPSDHNGMSTCTGACVVGVAGADGPGRHHTHGRPGVPGTVASVLQTNGTYQVTYNGSPLYTFVGDTDAGRGHGEQRGRVQRRPGRGLHDTDHVGARAHHRLDHPAAPTTTLRRSTTPDDAAPRAATSPRHRRRRRPPRRGTGTPAVTVPAAAGIERSHLLAFTGPGPALLWMVVVGAALLVTQLSPWWCSGTAADWPPACHVARVPAGGSSAAERSPTRHAVSTRERSATVRRPTGQRRRCRRAARPRTRPRPRGRPRRAAGARSPTPPRRRRRRHRPRRPGPGWTRRSRCRPGGR